MQDIPLVYYPVTEREISYIQSDSFFMISVQGLQVLFGAGPALLE